MFIAILVIVVLIFLFVVFPRGMLTLSAMIAVLIIAFIVNEERKSDARKAEEAIAAEKLRIENAARWAAGAEPSKIEIRDAVFTKSFSNSSYGCPNGGSCGTVDFSATAVNRSDKPVSALVIRFQAYDCPVAATQMDSCESLGIFEQQTNIYLPPNEPHGIRATPSISNPPKLRGALTWKVTVMRVRG